MISCNTKLARGLEPGRPEFTKGAVMVLPFVDVAP